MPACWCWRVFLEKSLVVSFISFAGWIWILVWRSQPVRSLWSLEVTVLYFVRKKNQLFWGLIQQFNSDRSWVVCPLGTNTEALGIVNKCTDDATFPCMWAVALSMESMKNESSSSACISVWWVSVTPWWHSPSLPVSLEKSSFTVKLCFGSIPAPSPLPGSSQCLSTSDFGLCLAHSASSRPGEAETLSPLATRFPQIGGSGLLWTDSHGSWHPPFAQGLWALASQWALIIVFP